MTRRFLSFVAFLTFMSATSSAADLTKVNRTIAKEPAYKTKPKYCLLVFGPEAKTKVWLVQDGDTLYVDRNGNGDLTEPDKKVAAEKQEGAEEGQFYFKVGDIRDGELVHKGLVVGVMKIDHMADLDEQVKAFLAKNPKGRGYLVMVEMHMPGWKGTGVGGRVQQQTFVDDVKGVLQFADKAQDAPIIHFGGPWQVTLFGAHKLTIGRETDVVLGVGTPGVGAGSTTYVNYEGVIPDTVYPTLEVTYAPKKPGEDPVREHYELKKRC